MEQRILSAGAVQWANSGRLRQTTSLIALAVVYYLAGKAGLHFAVVHSSASAVWPPTGIALAAALIFGWRHVWPAVLAGAFLVNLSASGSIVSSLGIAVGNTLESVVGAALITRHAGGAQAFQRSRDYLGFVVFGGLLGTSISATIGSLVLVASGEAVPTAFAPIWLTWWLGDMAGALIVTPVLLLWLVPGRFEAMRAHPFEAVVLLAAVVVTGALVLAQSGGRPHPLAFLCIPPLIWTAFRFGQREVATAVLLLSTIATWATVRGLGPFTAANDANQSLLLLQSFMVTISLLTMPVAALVWERKAIERERLLLLEREKAARAEAERASHAKDEFLAMLGHELRNPLAAIGNALQVLSSPGVPSGTADRALDIVHRQARHLTRLIDDLLDVSRISSGKMLLARERCDLADVVRNCVALLQAAGRTGNHGIQLELAPAWVFGDTARLAQVVDNLVTNALKYTPDGGVIEVRTEADQGEVRLIVSDDGMGIGPELLPHVFELFTQGPRTLDRAQGGLGLGLALAQRIVVAHGGRITASSPGTSLGSRFTVVLPGIEAMQAAAAHAEGPGDTTVIPRRVLIVEDNDDVRVGLRLQLSLAGHEVHEAVTGPEGVEAARRVRPDVVLLDIGLPGLDGYQVAQALRRDGAAPKIIAITGYGQPDDVERMRRAGIDDHLIKPVDGLELARHLSR